MVVQIYVRRKQESIDGMKNGQAHVAVYSLWAQNLSQTTNDISYYLVKLVDQPQLKGPAQIYAALLGCA